MTTVEEIKEAIARLSPSEYRELMTGYFPDENDSGADESDVQLHEERKDEPVKPMEEVFSELGL